MPWNAEGGIKTTHINPLLPVDVFKLNTWFNSSSEYEIRAFSPLSSSLAVTWPIDEPMGTSSFTFKKVTVLSNLKSWSKKCDGKKVLEMVKLKTKSIYSESETRNICIGCWQILNNKHNYSAIYMVFKATIFSIKDASLQKRSIIKRYKQRNQQLCLCWKYKKVLFKT